MKQILLILFAVLLKLMTVNAINKCNRTVFTDDFSSSTGWQSVGGGVNINGGKCNFSNVYCSTYNKVYKSIGTTLSNTYWKAECVFSMLNANPSGNGTGELIMALTAGTLDFNSYDASGSYAATNQDGIAVNLNSPSPTDNNTNNWQFLITSKKGNVPASPSYILAKSSISNYYIRLERISIDSARLSIFSDAAYTSHIPGSPISIAINSSITGLNTVQHGTNTWGASSRFINATIDNDMICDYFLPPVSKCNQTIFTDDFSSSTGWQSVGGGVNINGGKCNFSNVYCSTYNKVYKSIGTTLSNTYWKAECNFSILNANPSGNGTGELIMALTAGTLDFNSYDASGSYAATNQDGIAVNLNSPSPTDNNTNNWQFLIVSKKGNVPASPSYILANSSISNYYIRLERISIDSARLSIFSDVACTSHIAGSPISVAINSSITGLNTIQHGTNTWGSSSRFINATIDNDMICDNGAPYQITGIKKICKGDSTLLTTSGGNTYIWSTGSDSSSTMVSPLATTTYTVTLNDGVNIYTLTTVVTVNQPPVPTATITGSSPFCAGSINISSNYVNTNQWYYNGNIVSGATNQNYYPTQSGFYSVEVTDVNSCTGTSSIISITILPVPTLNISAQNSKICKGDSVTISINTNANHILWSTGDTTNQITVTPLSTSTYTVTVTTTGNGCTSSGTQTITVNPVPPIPTVLQNGSLLASSSSTGNQWNLNGNPIPGATGQFYSPAQSGFYSVTVKGTNGCTSTSTIFNYTGTSIYSIDFKNVKLNIYPNPSDGLIYIDLNSEIREELIVYIYNLLGDVVFSKIIPTKSKLFVIDLSDSVNNGIYTLMLKGNSGTRVEKVVFTK